MYAMKFNERLSVKVIIFHFFWYFPFLSDLKSNSN
jgi:hypothetical protein